ncbi:MAG TPA: hypothetical protein ENH82_16455, partial [bacterium]|nr:hypothetical protein [bacterium]
MIEPMVKIEIIGLLEELDGTLDILQQIGIVQIDEIPTIEGAEHTHVRRIHLDETKEHLLTRYEELSLTVSEILDIMSESDIEETPLDTETLDKLQKLSPDELLNHISTVSREVRRLARQRKNLLQDIESARQYEILINTFLPLLEKAGPVGDMEQIGIILNKGESSVLPILKNRLEEITGPKTMFFHEQMPDNKTGIFIVITPEDLQIVRQLLGNEGVSEYHIPREYRKKNFRESIETIRSRIENIPNELNKIDEQLLESKKTNASVLRFIHIISTNRMNQLRILPRLVRTRYTFVISGWTPNSSLKTIKKQLLERFNDRVYIGKVTLNELDFLHIPTLLTNRGIFRASEILMKLLPPPKYGNLDATPFIAIFFPIFFGIILGDMAYGIALLAIAGYIKLKASRGSLLSDVGTVALAAGISTIIFGFLYGEFLGDFGNRFGIKPLAPWLHREGAIEVILIMALGLGAFHIILGFILKVYVSIIIRHIKGAFEGLSKIIIIMGIVVIFAQLFLGLPIIVRQSAYVLLGIGIIGVFFSEGIIGILEIFSIFGNILSYSRIMAIGLASVILAVVANRLAEESNNIFAAILIGFVIHLINFVMGVFSPTIHSLRLHYVEFFGK